MGDETAVDMGRDSGSSSRGWGRMWKVHVGLILVQVGFGGFYVITKVALSTDVNPLIFTVYSKAVCLVILLPLACLTERKKWTPLSVPVLGLIAAFGILGPFGGYMAALYGLKLTAVAYSATSTVLTPIFTFIISMSCGIEVIRWRQSNGQKKAVGVLSSLSGAALLALYVGPVVFGSPDSDQHDIPVSKFLTTGFIAPILEHLHIGTWQLGIFLIFLSSLAQGTAFTISTPIMARYPMPISVCALAFTVSEVATILTSLAIVKDSSWVICDRAAIIAYTYNGVVVAAFSTCMKVWGVLRAGPVLVAFYLPLQLFSAVVMAYFFLGDNIHLGSILGTLLILTGLGFITWGKLDDGSKFAVLLNPAPVLADIPVGGGLEEPLLR